MSRISKLTPNLLQYDECVSLCSSSRPYEAAYALYRLGKFDGVLSMAAEKGDGSPQWQWLQAQAQFRDGQLQSAQAGYSALLSAPAGHDAQVEATVNYTAALIAEGKPIPPSVQPEGGADFEVAFNVATGHLHSGDVNAAGAALQSALGTARAALLAEGLSQSEADSELLPLTLQSAVVQQYTGDAQGAIAALRSAQRTAPRRSQASYVAGVNASVAAGSKDLFAAFTAVKAALAAADDAKLSASQQRLLQVNRAVLLAHMGKAGEAMTLAGELLAQGGAHEQLLQALLSALKPVEAGPAVHEQVAAAAALASGGDVGGAAARLLAAAKAAGDAQLPAVLAAYVHWALQAGQDPHDVAAAALSELASHPGSDAVVAARAAVVRVLHGAAHAAAAAHVLESGSIGSDADSAMLGTLVRAAAGSVTELPPAPPGVQATPLATLLSSSLPWSGTSASKAATPAVAPPTLPAEASKTASASAASEALSPAAARAARRHAARLRRRAKLREAHMEKLRNKAVYRSGAAIPKPDPERWLPFKARSYDRFGNLKRRPKAGAGAAAYKNTGASQGLAGSDTARAAAALDAKASAEAKAAAGDSGAASSGSGVRGGSMKAAPKVAAGLGKKKKRGKRR